MNYIKKIIDWFKDLYIRYRDFDKDYWFDPETEMYFPKCHLCHGKRSSDCPKSCLGDQ